MFARVALDLPVPTEFTYSVPDELLEGLKPGQRVKVPFRSSTRVGYCVALEQATDIAKTRPISAVLDSEPLVAPELLALARWIAEYYVCSLGEALQAMLPGGVRRGRPKVRRVERVGDAEPPARARKGRALLDALASFPSPPTPAELCARAGCSPAALKTLEKAGSVRVVALEKPDELDRAVAVARETPPRPAAAQAEALAAMADDLIGPRFAVHLLLGVTGSGKTEVYLRALEECVRRGRQAIVLVPEIALTPQTVRRFRARFVAVAVLHSMQGSAVRSREWRRIRRGEADVVIGPRSAVFAPVARLGLIVVDEEHENSFKQEQAPRYHARDVAILRAREAGCPILLGSATPSLESYANALRGRFHLHRLPARACGFALPEVVLIDMAGEKGRIFSQPLRHAVSHAVEEGGQVILFLNRRGFATVVICRRCDHAVGCPHCSSTLVFHKGRQVTACHLCGHETRLPTACPSCHAPGLELVGTGTERVEEEAREAWPEVPLVRLDSDTARGEALEAALERFRVGEARILVGTQMVAKGHHFPEVNLVGIVNADTALHLADFRANERTFSLIAQVAGRAGRGELGGRVLVQTFNPAHYAVRAAARHDYEGFAKAELEERKLVGLPPERRAALLVLSSLDEALAARAAAEVARAVAPAARKGGVEVRGPAKAPIARVRGRWRQMVLLLAPRPRALSAACAAARGVKLPGKVDLTIDVDPSAVL
ncbi:MAG: replication restart helicase PriA [Planctomycetaceae bacterium]